MLFSLSFYSFLKNNIFPPILFLGFPAYLSLTTIQNFQFYLEITKNPSKIQSH